MAYLVWTDEDTGADQAIKFDATVAVRVDHTADVTTHPVEASADVSDHSRANPSTISLEVFVTDTPVIPPETQTDGVTGSVQNLELPTRPPAPLKPTLPSGRLVSSIIDRVNPTQYSASVLQFTGRLNRVVNVFKVLDELLVNGTLVRVVTSLRDYDNMLITGVTAPRDSESGSGIYFNVELTQVLLVETEQTSAPTPSVPRGKKKQDGGKRDLVPDTADNGKAKSILSQILS